MVDYLRMGTLRPGRTTVVIGIAAMVHLAVYAALLPFPQFHPSLAVAYLLPIAVCCLIAALKLRSAKQGRVGVALVGLAMLAWLGGEAVYSAYSLQAAEVPFPSAADAFYYVGYAALMCGLASIAHANRFQQSARSLLELGIVLGVAAILSWQFFIVPTMASGEDDSFVAAVAAGYPLLDLGLLGTIVVGAYWFGGLHRDAGTRWLSVGVVLLLLADGIYTRLMLNGAELPRASALDLLWAAAYWMMAIGVVTLTSAGGEPNRKRDSEFAVAWPYAAIGVLAISLAGKVPHDRGSVPAIIATATVLTFVLARQWIVLRANRTLARDLEIQAEELHRLQAETLSLAYTDPLTSLLNRRAWSERAVSSDPIALALIDVDDFKGVNDTLGHSGGDRVLQRVAAMIVESVGDAGTVARVGGDEFAVAFHVPLEDATRLCREIVSAAGSMRTAETLTLGLSCGISIWRGSGPDGLATTYDEADVALYAAKRAGKRRVVEQSADETLAA